MKRPKHPLLLEVWNIGTASSVIVIILRILIIIIIIATTISNPPFDFKFMVAQLSISMLHTQFG